MATRIIVLEDCDLAFLEVNKGGGFRRKGYMVDIQEDYPAAIFNFRKKSSFYSCMNAGYIKVEYIVKPEHVYSVSKGKPIKVEQEEPNDFKRADKNDVFTEDNVVGGKEDKVKEIPEKDVQEGFLGNVEETEEEGDTKSGGIAPRTSDMDPYIGTIKAVNEVASTEDEVKSSIASVEEVEEAGDDEYMGGSAIPTEKTEEVTEYEETDETDETEETDKPYVETEVPEPEGRDEDYEDLLEVPTAHMSEPEFSLEDVTEFLVSKGISPRVAKSAARIIVEPISNTKKRLSLYGVNSGNLNEILGYLDEYRISKDPNN